MLNIGWVLFAYFILTATLIIVYVYIMSTRKKTVSDSIATSRQREKAIVEFQENANVFSNLYEPLFILKSGRPENGESVFANWNTHIEALNECHDLIGYWRKLYNGGEGWSESNYSFKATELLAFITEAGVSRSTDTEITANRETPDYYTSQGDIDVEDNIKLKVDRPYWSIGEHVLVKGQISLPENEEENTEDYAENNTVEYEDVNEDEYPEEYQED